jgi:hypothetical protein
MEQGMPPLPPYVVPITSILGRLALVPVGDTGTIPFSMSNEKIDYPGAICDSKGDGVTLFILKSFKHHKIKTL